MSRGSNAPRGGAHPFITSNLLYIVDPPAEATWDVLGVLFQPWGRVRPGEWRVLPDGRKSWAVIFQDVFHAEMALATLQSQEVPELDLSWRLALSPSATLVDLQPFSTGATSLYVQSTLSPYSSHELAYMNPQEVFEIFRNAGPLVSVRLGQFLNFAQPTYVLEFWYKHSASDAQRDGQKLHPALGGMSPFILTSSFSSDPLPKTSPNAKQTDPATAAARARNRMRQQVAKRKRELAQQAENTARSQWQKAVWEKRDIDRRVADAQTAHGGAKARWDAAEEAVQEAERVLEQMKAERGRAAQEKIDTQNRLNKAIEDQVQMQRLRTSAQEEEARTRAARETAEMEEEEVQREAKEAEEAERQEELKKMRERMEAIRLQEELERKRREMAELNERDKAERERKTDYCEPSPSDSASSSSQASTTTDHTTEEDATTSSADTSADNPEPDTESQDAEPDHFLRNYHDAVHREQARCRRRDRLYWAPSFAISKTSIERFTAVCIDFDDTPFSSSQPLTFESVPWPLLRLPLTMTLDDIEWAAVEQFFAELRRVVGETEYRVVLEKTHRRFHPDKWRSRGLLKTVLDEELRERLEVAGNVVAQAVTPLWLASRV